MLMYPVTDIWFNRKDYCVFSKKNDKRLIVWPSAVKFQKARFLNKRKVGSFRRQHDFSVIEGGTMLNFLAVGVTQKNAATVEWK